MHYNSDNPLKHHSLQSLEKEELINERFINKLVKLNLKKILKSVGENKRINVIVKNGRMYY